jgi:hypothetical protein
MEFAHRSDIYTMSRAEEDGKLLTMDCELQVEKGDIILTNRQGHVSILDEARFNEMYIPVQRVKKPVKKKLSPFEEMYAQQIAEFNGTLKQDESELHIGLTSNKAL